MKRSPLLRPALACGFAAGCTAVMLSAAALAQGRAGSAPIQLTPPPGGVREAPPGSDPILARMTVRMTQLENEIQRLTGQNEELAFRLRQLTEKLEKLASDYELRLAALEGTGKPAAAGAAPPAKAAPPAAAPPPATVPGADKGARVLGTVRPGAPGVAPAQPPTGKETPEQLYDRAYSLLAKQRDYGAAERVLKTFIEANPSHTLAPNAYYWLGRTYFVRGDFENAAFAFAEGFQKFPQASKAPATLLDLGKSLHRLGKSRDACTTYTRLLRTYTSVDESLKRKVALARQEAKCVQR